MSDEFFKKPILNSPYERPSRHWELLNGLKDHAAFDRLTRNSEVITLWLIRRSMKEFLDKYRHGGAVDVALGQHQAASGER